MPSFPSGSSLGEKTGYASKLSLAIKLIIEWLYISIVLLNRLQQECDNQVTSEAAYDYKIRSSCSIDGELPSNL